MWIPASAAMSASSLRWRPSRRGVHWTIAFRALELRPRPRKALRAHPVPALRSVLTFFAQDTGTHNLVYASADLTKASQNREVIAFCDHWKAASGSDPRMLTMDQRVTTQPVLGELDDRGVKFATLRMRSPVLMRQIRALTSKDFKTVALDRPGRHNRPKVAESAGVMTIEQRLAEIIQAFCADALSYPRRDHPQRHRHHRQDQPPGLLTRPPPRQPPRRHHRPLVGRTPAPLRIHLTPGAEVAVRKSALARAGHQGHQQHQPNRQRGRHRPPGLALPHVISRMADGLDPAIAADHRRGDRDRLAEDHQIPGTDRPRPGGHQRRPAIFPQALAGRGCKVRDPDGDRARLPEQFQPGQPARLAGAGSQAPRHATLAGQRSSLASQDFRHRPCRLAELRRTIAHDTPPVQDRYLTWLTIVNLALAHRADPQVCRLS
jgi:hypothetical protein